MKEFHGNLDHIETLQVYGHRFSSKFYIQDNDEIEKGWFGRIKKVNPSGVYRFGFVFDYNLSSPNEWVCQDDEKSIKEFLKEHNRGLDVEDQVYYIDGRFVEPTKVEITFTSGDKYTTFGENEEVTRDFVDRITSLNPRIVIITPNK